MGWEKCGTSAEWGDDWDFSRDMPAVDSRAEKVKEAWAKREEYKSGDRFFDQMTEDLDRVEAERTALLAENETLERNIADLSALVASWTRTTACSWWDTAEGISPTPRPDRCALAGRGMPHLTGTLARCALATKGT
jgi:hypothetical protein